MFSFVSIFKCFKKILIVKVFFCVFFSSFFPLKNICSFFFFVTILFHFIYLLIYFSFFLIWKFLCCFKKNSLVSLFFSTFFSFLKLVCSFWQIARLWEFFINCFCRHSSSSSSPSIIFFFRDEELGWMDDGTDGWKGRPPQAYHIHRSWILSHWYQASTGKALANKKSFGHCSWVNSFRFLKKKLPSSALGLYWQWTDQLAEPRELPSLCLGRCWIQSPSYQRLSQTW